MKEKYNFIFGIRASIEAIEAGKTIDKILVKKGLNNELFSELFTLIKQHNIPFQYVPIEKLNRVTRKNHQGIVSYISPVEFVDIQLLVPRIYELGKTPLILILDGITDTRNLGAIARSAECAGVDAIVIPTKGSALITADAVKTSAGALHYIPICRVENLKKTILFLMNSGIQIVAASEKSNQNFYEIDYSKPTAFVMGSEDKGISNDIIKVADEMVKIPMQGKISSLNVSVASSLFIFEAVRQREILNKN